MVAVERAAAGEEDWGLAALLELDPAGAFDEAVAAVGAAEELAEISGLLAVRSQGRA